MKSSELQSLHLRWHNKTGEDMPVEIASLPIDRIRRAVELTEKGITVVVPREAAATPTPESESSLRDWDEENND